MARKKRTEDHENLERWMVSYADFITLLFAFFVVMYAISSINEGKYRVLSDALVAAFRDPRKTVDPIQLGQITHSSTTNSTAEFIERPRIAGIPVTIVKTTGPDMLENTAEEAMDEDRRKARNIIKIAEAVSRALQQLVDQGLVNVRTGDQWLEVEIKDSVLYPSGSAQLQSEAIPVLHKVAEILRPFPNPIRVEGFTDNMPINTLLYPSNWELSGARAASVVRLFVTEGIEPKRMSALGYSEFRPIATNETAAGRAQNRRVVLVVLADEALARVLDQSPAVESAPR
jgi:chemotaxis protein MotB